MTTVDLIILAVMLIYVLIGLRRGFVMMIVHCLSGIVSFLAAVYVASHYADSLSESLIVPHLSDTIAASLRSNDSTASAAELWESQSEYLKGLLTKAGASKETIVSAQDPVATLAGAIASAVGQAIAYVILFLLVFFICSVAIHLVANLLNLVAHLPVIGACNALFGALLGAAFGLLLCTCVLWALKLFVPAVYSDYGVLPPSVMNRSQIAGTLVGWNDGISLFETSPAGS